MIYACDFETTVFKGQTETEVWLAGFLSTDFTRECIFNNLDDFMIALLNEAWTLTAYFHNLKFDGAFIVDWLERTGFKKALNTAEEITEQTQHLEDKNSIRWLSRKKMPINSYKCFINRKGQWYNIEIKTDHSIVTILDSVKLLPFSLAKIAEDMKLSVRKGTMIYEGVRGKNYKAKEGEIDYFKKDLRILAEALVKAEEYDVYGSTIGRCCLNFFIHQNFHSKREFNNTFPNLYEQYIEEEIYGSKSVGDYVLKSYKGAYVWLNPKFKHKVLKDGFTLDVTSLYASMEHSCSGNEYCFGPGKMCKGQIPQDKNKVRYQRLRCSFRLKEGYIPFITIKNTYLYDPKERLYTSKVVVDGEILSDVVELTLLDSELELFLEHYTTPVLEYLDYVEFFKYPKLFDKYVEYWADRKNNATRDKNAVLRFIAKLHQTNLYGKFAASKNDSFKIPYIGDGDKIRFVDITSEEANPGYIANGSKIVAEARIFEIKAFQSNMERCAYADTDSLHLVGEVADVKGLIIADDELCTFKLETYWKQGWFDSAKRYIETTEEILEGEKQERYHITCAGAPERTKKLLRYTLGERDLIVDNCLDDKPLTEAEQEFIQEDRTIEMFKKGLSVPGKLLSKRIKGGIVLEEGYFTIRN